MWILSVAGDHKLEEAPEFLEGSSHTDCWAYPQVTDSVGLGQWGREFPFLSSTQVILLVQKPHFLKSLENFLGGPLINMEEDGMMG